MSLKLMRLAKARLSRWTNQSPKEPSGIEIKVAVCRRRYLTVFKSEALDLFKYFKVKPKGNWQ